MGCVKHSERSVSGLRIGLQLVAESARTRLASFSGQRSTWSSARVTDSFAWRQPTRGGIRVIEVDHPSTQAWKRSRIEALGIPVPSTLSWAPVDFEVESVAAGLDRADGFGRTLRELARRRRVSHTRGDRRDTACTAGVLNRGLLQHAGGHLWVGEAVAVSKLFETVAAAAGGANRVTVHARRVRRAPR